MPLPLPPCSGGICLEGLSVLAAAIVGGINGTGGGGPAEVGVAIGAGAGVSPSVRTRARPLDRPDIFFFVSIQLQFSNF